MKEIRFFDDFCNIIVGYPNKVVESPVFTKDVKFGVNSLAVLISNFSDEDLSRSKVEATAFDGIVKAEAVIF